MRTLIWILSGILGFLFLLGAIGQLKRSAATPASKKQPKAQEQWITFVSSDGEYSVLMPAQPIEKEQLLQAQTGKVTMKSAGVDHRTDVGVVSYTICYNDFPVSLGDGEEFLTLAGDQMAETMGRIRAKKSIKLQNASGREYEIEHENGKALAATRCYVRGHRMYQTIALVPIRAGFSSNTWRFLDSFQFETNNINR